MIEPIAVPDIDDEEKDKITRLDIFLGICIIVIAVWSGITTFVWIINNDGEHHQTLLENLTIQYNFIISLKFW